MFQEINPKQSFPELEKKLLAFWKKEHIFKKSIAQRSTENEYVFYDGPPFATGLPHYGHILAGTIKDVIPRYFTMKGYRVERKFGWDCHGLPVENEVEKMLELKSKKDIEELGIDNFNEKCRSIVLKHVDEWEKTVNRMGRWVDFKDDYKTMDSDFMESIWWVFKSLWDKGLVYEGHKPMHICPRCETPLSNFEVTQGYQDVVDHSVYAKFKLLDEENTYIIAWTTTPWTLPGNVGLVVGKDIEYNLIEIAQYQHEDGSISNVLPTIDKIEDHVSTPEVTPMRIICAKNLTESIIKLIFNKYDEDEPYWTVIKTFQGSDLVGKKYEPLFNYFVGVDIENMENAYQVVHADFATDEDGTGIVHIAPAFGEDDMNAGKEKSLPFIQHVKMDGTFIDEVTDFAGRDTRDANMDIIRHLKGQDKVLKFKDYKHSYPHCWRCDTALLNYATSSWFVDIGKIKEKMLSANDKINWTPENLKHGRFGKWLENARDWAISRNRYWGTPLPIWRNEESGETVCIGSMRELQKHAPGKYTCVMVMRHGESFGNLDHTRQEKEPGTDLTEAGKAQATAAIEKVKKMGEVDIIIASPLNRTQQTAQIVADGLGLEIQTESRIREICFGEIEGLNDEQLSWYPEKRESNQDKRYVQKVGINSGESHKDVEERMASFVQEVIKKYPGKTVLLVTHSDPLRLLEKNAKGHSIGKVYSRGHKEYAEPIALYYDCETGKSVDLHKHFMDKVVLTSPTTGDKLTKIPEVLDCWFESGSMPYAQVHYPFENKERFEKNFPANFIAEGLDQTRGWFYTLTILAAALFDTPAFQNVVVNGIVLAEDGKKMSKRLKNYPDPDLIFNKYGADAMRFYLMNSPVVKGNDVRFSEKGVEEVVKSILLPIWNSYSFFVTYANIDKWQPNEEVQLSNTLDKYILSRVNTVIEHMTSQLDSYDLQHAISEIPKFIDDLTNWYIRRSRRRFWKSENDGDKFEAYFTLYTVLLTLSKIIAPFMPFMAEAMYQNLNRSNIKSVHLCSWPEVNTAQIDMDLENQVNTIRTIVNLGHASRAKSKIKVRQPLQKIQVGLPENISPELVKSELGIIQEELNVKEVELIADASTIAKVQAKPIGKLIGPKFGKDVQHIIKNAKEGNFKREENGNIVVFANINGEEKTFTLLFEEVEMGYIGKKGFGVESDNGIVIALDLQLTPELEMEGHARDIVRVIQDLRKEADYNVSDRITVAVCGAGEVVESFGEYIKKETLADDIVTSLDGMDKTSEVNGMSIGVMK